MNKREKLKTEYLEENGPCKICGSKENLHIHHIDPSTRIANDIWTVSKEKREIELSGCMVVCQSCHADIHTEMKRNGYKKEYHPERKLIFCKKCGRKRPPKGDGLCDSCHRAVQRNKKWIICEQCGERKHPYTSTLCNACYSKNSRKNPSERSLIICKVCGEKKQHEAGDMCTNCYKKDYYQNKNKIICNICKEEKSHHSSGKCAKCYIKEKRRAAGIPERKKATPKEKTIKKPKDKIICKVCNQEEYHEAKGMCKLCYEKERKKNLKPDIICKECNQEKIHYSKNMCKACYMKILRKNKKNNLPI